MGARSILWVWAPHNLKLLSLQNNYQAILEFWFDTLFYLDNLNKIIRKSFLHSDSWKSVI